MPCEMCGKDAPLKEAVIEGTKMRVCPDCLDYGEEVSTPQSSSASSGTATSGPPASSSTSKPSGGSGGSSKSKDVYEDTEEVLAEDYGEIVRKARQEKDLTVEELSDELNEKRSVIAKTERGDHHPRDELVQTLERFLDIELMVEMESSQRVSKSGSSSGGSGNMTLGDLIKDEMDED